MKITNTETRQTEQLTLHIPGKINMFVCGPTVYDHSHAGHAKTYTQFDFIVKYLKRTHNVTYLMNITDVDDKIINRANQENIHPLELSQKFSQAFFSDMKWLGNANPDITAYATEHIPEVINQIQQLIHLDVAYKLEDGWYFDLSKNYRVTESLAKRDILQDEQNITRVETKNKRNSGDFVLWKLTKPGEPFWESSLLGNGRPGWHIEDTAITQKYFGDSYDIHGGATDLIFPHHEAEILQMETLSHQKLATHWVHTGLLEVNGKKMGKSLNNFTTIRKLRENHSPLTIRLFFISRHYLSNIELNEKLLADTLSNRERVETLYRKTNLSEDTPAQQNHVERTRQKIYEALDNDFNTPEAFAHLYSFIRETNRYTSAGNQTRMFLEEMNDLFEVFDFRNKDDYLDRTVEWLVEAREEHRKKKEWQKSDAIRDLLLTDYSVIVEDTPNGPFWYTK